MWIVITVVTTCIVLILSVYGSINKHYFSNPMRIMLLGFVFIFFSAMYKFVIGEIVQGATSNILPFIDFSTAALGGGLIASAFIIKAQLEHNAAKSEVEELLANAREQLEQMQSLLKTICERESSMTEEDYQQKLSEIVRGLTLLRQQIRDLEDDKRKRSLL